MQCTTNTKPLDVSTEKMAWGNDEKNEKTEAEGAMNCFSFLTFMHIVSTCPYKPCTLPQGGNHRVAEEKPVPPAFFPLRLP